MITAVVGAGGKTTLIHKLAQQYRKEGKRVFVTTSTHMFIEPDSILTGNAEQIIRCMEETGYAMAGMPVGEKITALPRSVYEAVCAYADEVLVEADGSKHLPVKFPGENEPVIPENAGKVIVVCGLHALGKTAREAVFRLDKAKQHIEICDDTIITPPIIQQLVRKGYLEMLMKQHTGKITEIYAANDGSPYQRALATLIEADTDLSLPL